MIPLKGCFLALPKCDFQLSGFRPMKSDSVLTQTEFSSGACLNLSNTVKNGWLLAPQKHFEEERTVLY